MLPQKDLAIVLRVTPYEERHKIVNALTQSHGQIVVMAKNSIHSRRLGGTLDLFAAGEWVLTSKAGSELFQLKEATIREPFEGLRKDFSKLSLASAMSELMLRLAPQNECCADLFRLHSNALSALSSPEFQVGGEIILLNAYLAKILQWSGSQPRLQTCIQCQCPIENIAPHLELTCLIAQAGWICPQCRVQETRHIQEQGKQTVEFSLLRLSCQSIRDFLLSLTCPVRQALAEMKASAQEHRSLFRWIEALYVYHIPGFDRRSLKALRFLDLEPTVPPEVKTLR